MTWGELKSIMQGTRDEEQVKIINTDDESVAYPISDVGYSNEHDAHVLRFES